MAYSRRELDTAPAFFFKSLKGQLAELYYLCIKDEIEILSETS